MFSPYRFVLHLIRGCVSWVIRSSCFRLFFISFVFVLVVTALFCGPVHSQSSNGSDVEYRVKAAFILNFTKFVTWPNRPHVEDNTPITLCVLGVSPFGTALDSIRNKKIYGHPIEIVYAPDPEVIPPCQIIFFGGNLETEEAKILKRFQSEPVLTVGEQKGFANRGGMINFIVVENKVRFEINPHSVEAASLKISSQLLKLSVIVETEELSEN